MYGILGGVVSLVFLSISQSALGPLSLSETTYLLSEVESLREVRIDSYMYVRTYMATNIEVGVRNQPQLSYMHTYTYMYVSPIYVRLSLNYHAFTTWL